MQASVSKSQALIKAVANRSYEQSNAQINSSVPPLNSRGLEAYHLDRWDKRYTGALTRYNLHLATYGRRQVPYSYTTPLEKGNRVYVLYMTSRALAIFGANKQLRSGKGRSRSSMAGMQTWNWSAGNAGRLPKHCFFLAEMIGNEEGRQNKCLQMQMASLFARPNTVESIGFITCSMFLYQSFFLWQDVVKKHGWILLFKRIERRRMRILLSVFFTTFSKYSTCSGPGTCQTSMPLSLAGCT